MALLALLVPCSALVLGPRLSAPTARQARASIRCGFEVEELSQSDVMEMNVMNWPGLEKRTSAFSQSASDEEVKMVYVKDGEATVSDAEETKTVGPGSLIMIQGGQTKWDVAEGGGITLISLVTSTDEVTGEGVAKDSAAPKEAEELEPVTLKEYAGLLGAGLLLGFVLSVGSTLLQSSGLLAPP